MYVCVRTLVSCWKYIFRTNAPQSIYFFKNWSKNMFWNNINNFWEKYILQIWILFSTWIISGMHITKIVAASLLIVRTYPEPVHIFYSGKFRIWRRRAKWYRTARGTRRHAARLAGGRGYIGLLQIVDPAAWLPALSSSVFGSQLICRSCLVDSLFVAD
jgi:hypothetical protein